MYVATLFLKLIGTRIRRRSHLMLMKTYINITLLPMGNTIESYRAAIGYFYSVTDRLTFRRVPRLNLNLLFNMYCSVNIFGLLGLSSLVKNDKFKFYKLILLCMDIHSNPGPDSDGIHSLDIVHLNTRSIRNEFEFLPNLVESIQIACFTETHLDANVSSSSLILEGFDEPLRKDRTRNGGGILVYLSNFLKYNRQHDLESPNIETIRVEIKLKYINLHLCCLYRSDFNASQSLFINEIQNSIFDCFRSYISRYFNQRYELRFFKYY